MKAVTQTGISCLIWLLLPDKRTAHTPKFFPVELVGLAMPYLFNMAPFGLRTDETPRWKKRGRATEETGDTWLIIPLALPELPETRGTEPIEVLSYFHSASRHRSTRSSHFRPPNCELRPNRELVVRNLAGNLRQTP